MNGFLVLWIILFNQNSNRISFRSVFILSETLSLQCCIRMLLHTMSTKQESQLLFYYNNIFTNFRKM